MKKMILLGLILLGTFAMIGRANYTKNLYSLNGTVNARSGDLVSIVDNKGNEWMMSVTDDDSLMVGNKVELLMNNENTELIYDDEIINYTLK